MVCYSITFWLVVDLPLWKIWKSMERIIPYIMEILWKIKNVWNHQPALRCLLIFLGTLERLGIIYIYTCIYGPLFGGPPSTPTRWWWSPYVSVITRYGIIYTDVGHHLRKGLGIWWHQFTIHWNFPVKRIEYLIRGFQRWSTTAMMIVNYRKGPQFVS